MSNYIFQYQTDSQGPDLEAIVKNLSTLTTVKEKMQVVEQLENRIIYVERSKIMVGPINIVSKFYIRIREGRFHQCYMSYLTDQNNVCVKSTERHITQLLQKQLLKLNVIMKFGAFFIHNQTGIISYKLNNITQQDSLFKELVAEKMNHDKITRFFTCIRDTAMATIESNYHKILYILNYFGTIQIEGLEADIKYPQTKKIPEQITNQLKQLELLSQGFREIQLDGRSDIFRPLDQFQDQLQVCDQHETKRVKVDLTVNMPADIKNQYKQHFQPLQVKEKISILSEIYIEPNQNLQSAQTMADGGFATISRMKLNYRLAGQSSMISRYLGIKQAKSTEHQHKIIQEIQILKHMSKDENAERSGQSIYIGTYYYSNQPEYKDYLFMEFFYHLSLDQYRAKKGDQYSLLSKIFCLTYICSGLRYIQSYRICHLDLKPANIFLAKNLIAKIGDFAEAVPYDRLSKADRQSARTLPFSAPESLSQLDPMVSERWPHKIDVFSFGMMAYEFLFNKFPIDFDKNKLEILENSYQAKNYQIRTNDYLDTQGFQPVMNILRNLFLQCLSPKPEHRPHLDWVHLILKEAQYIVDILT